MVDRFFAAAVFRSRAWLRRFLLCEGVCFALIFFLLPNHDAPAGDMIVLSAMIGLPIGFVVWLVAGIMKFALARS